ncbi:MAG: NAD+ synthase [Bacteroidetes bacterium]|nr:MAG: NAD+ synthase [Bacteroidota bacterium]
MKIALAQLNYHIGNFEQNTRKIIDNIKRAKQQGADLVVFSELSICGYPSGDFLEFSDYIHKCDKALEQILPYCDTVAAIVGAPHRNLSGKGKPLFNAAFFLENQKVKHICHKGLLPNYDIFDEYRYFEPATSFHVTEFKGKRIAISICEDLWNLNDNPLYTGNPMEELAQQGAEIIINIAASPFSWDHRTERETMLTQNARKYGLPLFYVNQVGAQTEIVFDGGSMAINPKGEITEELSYFEEDFKIFQVDKIISQKGRIPEKGEDEKRKIEVIYQALILGIKDYFGKIGFKQAILGLSGGIDSAVTMAIAADALGAENVLGVLMPSAFSSDHSVEDAQKLAENLGCPFYKIPIKNTTDTFEAHLKPWFENLPFNVAEENIQARTRAVYLMALSNKFGHVLLNTSNKSEAAVGYGTLYGDMCGGLSVLGDVYKTDVFRLARYINKDKERIPVNSITKPPSAELRPDQKDSDSLPEYDILDPILFNYIELRKSPGELYQLGLDKEVVDRVLKMVNFCEYKRYQTPPVIRVSSKAFGMGRKMPIVARYLG